MKAAIAWDQAHHWPVRVYYEDTDAGGVVFYANYLKFMERARTEWLRELGVEQQKLAQESDIGFVVAGLDIKYCAPARLDDHLIVQTTVTQAGRASLNFAQRVVLANHVIAHGEIRVGCVRLSCLKPAALPETLLNRILNLDKR
ncbi:tol-pal system-associated acyl-CoA thioesterase [Orrella daihaiensis]|uniref:Tol-pal system-associated acyl-CoA thioesterase n=1 Tax=Orrella daihaiensis TaxID=2782176 RepID=A0ABY4AKL2_9BURK|nr:tol-pal system-associated acyl-CoA thioesterase [Orrella daihaiensis]UOD50819.1 tol-pal system-associated acyl-CoA thioesterase [Orrella daihaiensis]